MVVFVILVKCWLSQCIGSKTVHSEAKHPFSILRRSLNVLMPCSFGNATPANQKGWTWHQCLRLCQDASYATLTSEHHTASFAPVRKSFSDEVNQAFGTDGQNVPLLLKEKSSFHTALGESWSLGKMKFPSGKILEVHGKMGWEALHSNPVLKVLSRHHHQAKLGVVASRLICLLLRLLPLLELLVHPQWDCCNLEQEERQLLILPAIPRSAPCASLRSHSEQYLKPFCCRFLHS